MTSGGQGEFVIGNYKVGKTAIIQDKQSGKAHLER